MSRRRWRGPKDHFARIPEPVMRSAAYRTLPHSARSTLAVLAVQFYSLTDGTQANGIQLLTREICARYGLSHDMAIRDARILEAHALSERVQKGEFRRAPLRSIPSRYAVGWLPITHEGSGLLEKPRPAPNGWREWRPPGPKCDCQSCTQLRASGAVISTLRTSEDAICQRCGTAFVRQRSSGRYCSSRCRTATYRANAKPPTLERPVSVTNSGATCNANAKPADSGSPGDVTSATQGRPLSVTPGRKQALRDAKPADPESAYLRSSPEAGTASSATVGKRS